MTNIKKQSLSILLIILLIFTTLPAIPASAANKNETENNNTYDKADITYNDYNNYGSIGGSSDSCDWWSITFSSSGMANFWLGGYGDEGFTTLYLYESDGSYLIAQSYNSGGQYQLIRARVYAGVTYLVKIEGENLKTLSALDYQFRAKVYPLDGVKMFTFNNSTINTRASATAALPNFWIMGYDAGEYLNNTAKIAAGTMSSCDVFIVHGKSSAGQMSFSNSTLYAHGSVSSSSSNASISSFSDESLSGVNLIIYLGSNTGLTTAANENLLFETLDKGAMCCLTWMETTNLGDQIKWMEQYSYELLSGFLYAMHSIILRVGYTIRRLVMKQSQGYEQVQVKSTLLFWVEKGV